MHVGGHHRCFQAQCGFQAARPASQSASQSDRRPAIIWGHPRTTFTPAAPVSGVSEITDTEEVTGSNPVSPTKKALVSHPFCDLARACGGWIVDLSAKCRAYRLASPSKSSLMARAPRVMTGAQFLPVHALGDACTSMADEVCDLLNGHPRA
jgi:hypothetical protein